MVLVILFYTLDFVVLSHLLKELLVVACPFVEWQFEYFENIRSADFELSCRHKLVSVRLDYDSSVSTIPRNEIC